MGSTDAAPLDVFLISVAKSQIIDGEVIERYTGIEIDKLDRRTNVRARVPVKAMVLPGTISIQRRARHSIDNGYQNGVTVPAGRSHPHHKN